MWFNTRIGFLLLKFEALLSWWICKPRFSHPTWSDVPYLVVNFLVCLLIVQVGPTWWRSEAFLCGPHLWMDHVQMSLVSTSYSSDWWVAKLDIRDHLMVKILGKFYFAPGLLLICNTGPVSITLNSCPVCLITSLSKLCKTVLPASFFVLCCHHSLFSLIIFYNKAHYIKPLDHQKSGAHIQSLKYKSLALLTR